MRKLSVQNNGFALGISDAVIDSRQRLMARQFHNPREMKIWLTENDPALYLPPILPWRSVVGDAPFDLSSFLQSALVILALSDLES